MKKRIAFYIESFIVGGAEKVLIDLVNNLDTDKFDIHVISIFKKSVYPHYTATYENVFNSNIKYCYLINNEWQWLSKLFNFSFHRVRKDLIYKLLIKTKFDVEVAFYEGLPTDFIAFSNQPSKKIAWLHTLQTNIYKGSTENRVAESKSIYSIYDTVIGVSNAVSLSFSEIFPELNAVTCFNPINDQFILQQAKATPANGIAKNQLIFVAVGRLTEVKGFERLINVFSRLRNENYDFHLQVIGDGHLYSKLVELIRIHQLGDRVSLLGHQPNPYPFIKNADCLISTSFYEGLSMVLIEAQILKIPAITTDCGGTAEVVNENTGIVCENSELGIYRAVKAIMDDPDKLKEIKKNFLNKPSIFNLKNSINKIEKILTQ